MSIGDVSTDSSCGGKSLSTASSMGVAEPPKLFHLKKQSKVGPGRASNGPPKVTPEKIVFRLRVVEVPVGQGESIATAYRKITVTEQTSIPGAKSRERILSRLAGENRGNVQ
jgi:hypothetical protein